MANQQGLPPQGLIYRGQKAPAVHEASLTEVFHLARCSRIGVAMDTTSLLQAIYKAFREKRLADAISHLADDFRLVVHLPEDALPGGDRPRSKAEAALLFQGFINDYDFLAYDQGPIIVTGDHPTSQPQIFIGTRRRAR
jgi:hypothetical protein